MVQADGAIDVHHHIVPKEYIDSLSEKGVKKALGVRFPKWDAKKTLDVMDGAGIAAAVVSISAPGVYFKEAVDPIGFAVDLSRQMNEFCTGLIENYPGRFGAFATLPLPDIDAALKELGHAMDSLKLDGVILLSNYDGFYLGDPRFEKLFTELNRRKAVVFVHPTSPPGIEQSLLNLPEAMMDVCFDTTRTAFSLMVNGVTKRHPDVRFILAHAGGTVPYIAGRVNVLSSLFASLGGAAAALGKGIGLLSSVVPGMKESLPDELSIYLRVKDNMPEGPDAYLRRFYYDTAVSASPHVFSSLQTVAENSHVLFGSDFPFATQTAVPLTIDGVKGYNGFDSRAQEAIMRGNAAGLFPRLQQSVA